MAAPARKKHETLFEPRLTPAGVYLLPVVLLPPVCAVAGVIFTRLSPGKFPEWPFAAIGALGALIAVAKWMLDIFRIRRILRTHGRFLCLNCHYPLNGLAESGNCPECDHPYERANTERRWKTWEETVNKGRPLV